MLGENNLTPENLRQLIEQDRKRQNDRNGNALNDNIENEETAIDKTLKKIKDKFKNTDKAVTELEKNE